DRVGEYYHHRPSGSGFVDRQKFRMNQAAFEAAAALVTWSKWTRASLIEDYAIDPSRIQVLAPGAAEAYFSIGERRSARTTAGHPVKVLFVGADFKRKGGPLLLDCMSDLTDTDKCELHLVTSVSVEPRHNVYVHNGLTANSPQLLDLFA